MLFPTAVSFILILWGGISYLQAQPGSPPIPVEIPGTSVLRSSSEPTIQATSLEPIPKPKTPQVVPVGGRYEDDGDVQVHTELPGLEELTRRYSEKDFFERLRKEARSRPGSTAKVYFPEEPPLTKEPFAPRIWQKRNKKVEPCYVNHGRLYFEQPNFERQGWDLGLFQTSLCLGLFYFDVITLPYHVCTRPFEKFDSSAGKCLPGDQVPLLLFPPELSVTGLTGQAGTIVSGFFFLP